ncbi:unnamed protein product [Chrysoparadoxa australica]
MGGSKRQPDPHHPPHPANPPTPTSASPSPAHSSSSPPGTALAGLFKKREQRRRPARTCKGLVSEVRESTAECFDREREGLILEIRRLEAIADDRGTMVHKLEAVCRSQDEEVGALRDELHAVRQHDRASKQVQQNQAPSELTQASRPDHHECREQLSLAFDKVEELTALLEESKIELRKQRKTLTEQLVSDQQRHRASVLTHTQERKQLRMLNEKLRADLREGRRAWGQERVVYGTAVDEAVHRATVAEASVEEAKVAREELLEQLAAAEARARASESSDQAMRGSRPHTDERELPQQALQWQAKAKALEGELAAAQQEVLELQEEVVRGEDRAAEDASRIGRELEHARKEVQETERELEEVRKAAHESERELADVRKEAQRMSAEAAERLQQRDVTLCDSLLAALDRAGSFVETGCSTPVGGEDAGGRDVVDLAALVNGLCSELEGLTEELRSSEQGAATLREQLRESEACCSDERELLEATRLELRQAVQRADEAVKAADEWERTAKEAEPLLGELANCRAVLKGAQAELGECQSALQANESSREELSLALGAAEAGRRELEGLLVVSGERERLLREGGAKTEESLRKQLGDVREREGWCHDILAKERDEHQREINAVVKWLASMGVPASRSLKGLERALGELSELLRTRESLLPEGLRIKLPRDHSSGSWEGDEACLDPDVVWPCNPVKDALIAAQRGQADLQLIQEQRELQQHPAVVETEADSQREMAQKEEEEKQAAIQAALEEEVEHVSKRLDEREHEVEAMRKKLGETEKEAALLRVDAAGLVVKKEEMAALKAALAERSEAKVLAESELSQLKAQLQVKEVELASMAADREVLEQSSSQVQELVQSQVDRARSVCIKLEAKLVELNTTKRELHAVRDELAKVCQQRDKAESASRALASQLRATPRTVSVALAEKRVALEEADREKARLRELIRRLQTGEEPPRMKLSTPSPTSCPAGPCTPQLQPRLGVEFEFGSDQSEPHRLVACGSCGATSPQQIKKFCQECGSPKRGRGVRGEGAAHSTW